MQRIARTFGIGAAAGLACLASTQLLWFIARGELVPISWGMRGVYLAAGCAAALIVDASYTLVRLRGPPLSTLMLGSAAAALLYAGPVAQRVGYVLRQHGLSHPSSDVGAVLALALYLGWIVILGLATGSRHRWLAPALGMFSARAVIRMNQEIFFSPADLVALAADVGVLLLTFGFALLPRTGPRLRRTAVLVATSIVVLALGLRLAGPKSPHAPGAPATGTTSVVLILVDTLRADVFDQVLEQTAEGHRLAAALRGSAWFPSTTSAAPWTPPSVASILTGLYPEEHGLQLPPRPSDATTKPLHRLSPEVRTLAEDLRDRGYATIAVVANALLTPTFGIARGFARYDLLTCSRKRLVLLSTLVSAHIISCAPYENARAVRRRLEKTFDELDDAGAPFFLWIHLMDPHQPLAPTQGLSPDPAGEDLPELDRLYRDRVRFVAREVALILEEMQEHAWWPLTLVILTADHGEMFPSDERSVDALDRNGLPRLYGHGQALYEELTHVPLVIRPPGGLAEDRRVELVASDVDLRNTIIEVLGFDIERSPGHSYSLAPWLLPEPPSPAPRLRREAFVSSNNLGPVQEALRGERYKLIYYPDGEHPPELYDLDSDPRERVSLAEREPQVLAAKLDHLVRLHSDVVSGVETRQIPLTKDLMERMRALGYVE